VDVPPSVTSLGEVYRCGDHEAVFDKDFATRQRCEVADSHFMLDGVRGLESLVEVCRTRFEGLWLFGC